MVSRRRKVLAQLAAVSAAGSAVAFTAAPAQASGVCPVAPAGNLPGYFYALQQSTGSDYEGVRGNIAPPASGGYLPNDGRQHLLYYVDTVGASGDQLQTGLAMGVTDTWYLPNGNYASGFHRGDRPLGVRK
jgi:hypothetical protein